MDTTCPYCRHVVVVQDGAPGQNVRCANCGARFPLPASAAEPPSSQIPRNGPSGEPKLSPPALPPTPPAAQQSPAPADGVALASLILSILVFIPLLTQVVAILLAVVALVRRRPAGERRPGAAWAAIVIATIALMVWAWLLVTFVQAARSAATFAGSPYWGTGMGSVGVDESAADESANAKEYLAALFVALDAYRRDYRAWPADVDALVPTYLSQSARDDVLRRSSKAGESLITLRTPDDLSRAEPETIIAFSTTVTVDAVGESLAGPHRWILLRNGQVVLKPAAEVDILLNRTPSIGATTNGPATTHP